MVKLKEGIVMTARERQAFERDNARPRKSWGRVDYYYKPQTKYPPRIYVFMHAESGVTGTADQWGYFTQRPFFHEQRGD